MGAGGYITKEGVVRVPEREERLEHQRGRRVGVTGYQGGRVRVAGREEKLEYRGREGLEYQGCCCLLLLLLLLLFRSLRPVVRAGSHAYRVSVISYSKHPPRYRVPTT